MSENYWEIDKSFSFCYGHRVFSQKIDTDFTERGHTCAKCRRLHGHEGLVKVFLKGEGLNPEGMVFDFVNMGFIKNFLDDHIDHKFILSLDDPWFVNIINATPVYEEGELIKLIPTNPLNTKEENELKVEKVFIAGTDHFAGYNIDVEGLQGPEREFFEGFFLVHFVPTSEMLSKWLFECVEAKMSTVGVSVSKVEWNETPKSRAVYAKA